MEFRKRARLEIVSSQNEEIHNLYGNGDSGVDTTVLATKGDKSYLLNGHQVAALTAAGQCAEVTATLPANILLTICDENSEEESQEFIIDSSVLTQIKQEHNVAMQTSSLPLPSSQLPSLAWSVAQSSISSQANSLMPLPTQYRLITNTNINKNVNSNNTIHQQQQYIGQHKAIANSDNSSTIILNSSTGCDMNTTAAAANFLTNAVQLPPGCEIYLLKEFLDVPVNCSTSLTQIETNSDGIGGVEINDVPDQSASNIPTEITAAIIKNESDMSQVLTSSNAADANVQNLQQQQITEAYDLKSSNLVAICHHGNNSTAVHDDPSNKRSYKLETHKKRDDKRRATHNEVERRRRDKINSWIFKLKEMLPTDMNVVQQRPIQQQQLQNPTQIHERTAPTTATTTIISSTTTTATDTANGPMAIRSMQKTQPQQESLYHNSTRAPPNDSKSQILIKACEYIKCMQDEIKSLHQCFKENQNLRLCNQRLQEELYYLRQKQMKYENTESNESDHEILAVTTTANVGKNNLNTIIGNDNCSHLT